mgnify:CR=1 FL=1
MIQNIPCIFLIVNKLSNLRHYQGRIQNIEKEGIQKYWPHSSPTTQVKIDSAKTPKIKALMTTEIEGKAETNRHLM